MKTNKPRISNLSNESSLDDFGSDIENEKRCKPQNSGPVVCIQGYKSNTEQAGKPGNIKDECDLEDDSIYICII